MKIRVAQRNTPLWSGAGRLARQIYSRAYGAEINPDPDSFIVGHHEQWSADGTGISACVGITRAGERPFFSERYLEDPIETVIGKQFGDSVERSRIVEVGALAGRERGAGQEMVKITPVISWYMGMEYILCTTTVALRRVLERAEIGFVPVDDADPVVLGPEERRAWGTYYDQEPQVGVISLRNVSGLFAEMTGRYSFIEPDPLGEPGSPTGPGSGPHTYEEVLSGAGS
ncbi:thermostable hemolysin [Kitasatospora sp. NPDC002227]|uniref:thermostable hemolysin n=1 Tax=Kitasatospora sp. NPDC002227 TaxID=3154773 RepID=UPI0033270BC6